MASAAAPRPPGPAGAPDGDELDLGALQAALRELQQVDIRPIVENVDADDVATVNTVSAALKPTEPPSSGTSQEFWAFFEAAEKEELEYFLEHPWEEPPGKVRDRLRQERKLRGLVDKPFWAYDDPTEDEAPEDAAGDDTSDPSSAKSKSAMASQLAGFFSAKRPAKAKRSGKPAKAVSFAASTPAADAGATQKAASAAAVGPSVPTAAVSSPGGGSGASHGDSKPSGAAAAAGAGARVMGAVTERSPTSGASAEAPKKPRKKRNFTKKG